MHEKNEIRALERLMWLRQTEPTEEKSLGVERPVLWRGVKSWL
jgi:hypothetical protein